jgi:hypothetical protein
LLLCCPFELCWCTESMNWYMNYWSIRAPRVIRAPPSCLPPLRPHRILIDDPHYH